MSKPGNEKSASAMNKALLVVTIQNRDHNSC